MTPEIKANVTFIQSLYDNGYDQVPLSAIPFPHKLSYSKSKCPILEVTGSLVLISTNNNPNKDRKTITQLLADATPRPKKKNLH